MWSLVAWIAGCQAPSSPPPQLVRRLTRIEYDNTVADLLHTRLRPAARLFQVDAASALGFDNQSDLLTLTPVLVEQYERAADQLVDDLMRPRDETRASLGAPANGPLVQLSGGEMGSRGALFVGPGSLTASLSVRDDGTYRITIQAFGRGSGERPVRILVEHDGEMLGVFVVPDDELGEVTLEAYLPVGPAAITVHYANPSPQTDEEARRGLVVRGVEAEGPLMLEQGPRQGYDEVIQCAERNGPEGDACAEQTLTRFASEAWRRPATPDDVVMLLDTYDEARAAGLGWSDAVGTGMKLVLLSPEFLFKVEQPAVTPGQPLSAHELAVRLSYFLWRAPPDEALRAAADDGSLLERDVLEASALRLLDHPRAHDMQRQLAKQWLRVSAFDELRLDPALYPEMDDALRVSLAEEVVRSVTDSMAADRSMVDLLTLPTTWVDDRLAEHYGVAFDATRADSDGGYAVDVGSLGRSGFVDLAGVLSLTSLYDHPSAVRRAWHLLDTLLCESLDDPPPGVDAVLEEVNPDDFSVVREYEEAVRAGADCQLCHTTLDPLGFALHGYGASGLPRDRDRWGAPIDSSTTLAEGIALGGAADVTDWLRAEPRVAECMVRRTFAWAHGRAPTDDDAATLSALTRSFTKAEHRFDALALAIVRDPSFRLAPAPEALP